MLRKDADRYLKQIAAMANANVPEEERVNLHAHLMRHTALKQPSRSSGGRSPRRRAGTSACSTSSGTFSRRTETTSRRWTSSIRSLPVPTSSVSPKKGHHGTVICSYREEKVELFRDSVYYEVIHTFGVPCSN